MDRCCFGLTISPSQAYSTQMQRTDDERRTLDAHLVDALRFLRSSLGLKRADTIRRDKPRAKSKPMHRRTHRNFGLAMTRGPFDDE